MFTIGVCARLDRAGLLPLAPRSPTTELQDPIATN
jgi:hypothetical protein